MKDLLVSIDRKLLQAIFESARRLHPRETILPLRRGKSKGNSIKISELLFPPLATCGMGFANVPIHMFPIDFSIVGMVHSHPSGNSALSTTDLNHFFGSILMIVASPYKDERNVAIYNRQGNKLILQIMET